MTDDDTFDVRTIDTPRGACIEVWNRTFSDDRPLAMLPAGDAQALAEAILSETGGAV